MRKAAGAGFSTATDLADWLVQALGLTFRQAHEVTGRIVAARRGAAACRSTSCRWPRCGRSSRRSPMPCMAGSASSQSVDEPHELRRHRAAERAARGAEMAQAAREGRARIGRPCLYGGPAFPQVLPRTRRDLLTGVSHRPRPCSGAALAGIRPPSCQSPSIVVNRRRPVNLCEIGSSKNSQAFTRFCGDMERSSYEHEGSSSCFSLMEVT